MKIDEYKKISDNVQVPDVVWEGYQNAIKQIKMEKETDKNIVKISKWKNVNALAKIAVVFGAVVLLSGGTFLSVKAYISHLEKIRNMEAEEVIDLYENIFQYDSKYMSRSMSADEERRFSELMICIVEIWQSRREKLLLFLQKMNTMERELRFLKKRVS